MSDWISWGEAVEVVALHVPADRAAGLLHVAIRTGDRVKVRAADEGGEYLAEWPGYQYFPAEPDQVPGPDNRRLYRKVNFVDLQSLKLWLKALTSPAEPTIASAEAAALRLEENRAAEPRARDTEQPGRGDDENIYRNGAPGRPTSAHLVEAELQRRVTTGDLCETLASEARYLSQWLTRTHPNAPRMKPKTVSNKCRIAYWSARKTAPEMKSTP